MENNSCTFCSSFMITSIPLPRLSDMDDMESVMDVLAMSDCLLAVAMTVARYCLGNLENYSHQISYM
jgi:hypothetical protein